MPSAAIYTLIDPSASDAVDRVRYVGQTRLDPAARLRRHWVTALAGAKEHRAVWMRAMYREGREVGIEVIDYVLAEEIDVAEQRHIKRLRLMGCDLTNRTDGGRGRRGWEVSAETRRKMSAAAKQRKATPETRARMSAALRASEKHKAHLARLHERMRGRPKS